MTHNVCPMSRMSVRIINKQMDGSGTNYVGTVTDGSPGSPGVTGDGPRAGPPLETIRGLCASESLFQNVTAHTIHGVTPHITASGRSKRLTTAHRPMIAEQCTERNVSWSTE